MQEEMACDDTVDVKSKPLRLTSAPFIQILLIQLEMLRTSIVSIAPGSLVVWAVFMALDAVEDLNLKWFGKLDGAALSVIVMSLTLEFTNMCFYTFRLRGFNGILIHATTSMPVVIATEVGTLLLSSALCRPWVRVSVFLSYFIGTWAGLSIWNHIFAKRRPLGEVLEKIDTASPSSGQTEKPPEELSFVPFLVMTVSLTLATTITMFIPTVVIQFSLSSTTVLILSNLILPTFQVLVLFMVKSITTSETQWALRTFNLLAIQFPTKVFLSVDFTGLQHLYAVLTFHSLLLDLYNRPNITGTLDTEIDQYCAMVLGTKDSKANCASESRYMLNF
ncbi:hypothetical protein BC829DRAFT_390313 [Chytridium lagenaria]|nr:hypothetical protein BC829DRAFT_390313 [Chytridium lagenaria]